VKNLPLSLLVAGILLKKEEGISGTLPFFFLLGAVEGEESRRRGCRRRGKAS